MTMPRLGVYAAIDSERDYQDKKWGTTQHEMAAWILFMEHYLHQAREDVSVGDYAEAVSGVRKVAGLAVACMEQHGVPKR